MFEALRQAFKDAIRNFRQELHRDEIPEEVDRIVSGMRNEAAEAKVRLRDLEDGIARARAEAQVEAKEADTCRRREQMARKIGDEETAKIAGEFAEKHERRRQVLEQKAQALEQELQLRRSEVDDMLGKIKEAERSRDTLSAAAGRTQARQSVRSGDALFDELDRMADLMGGSGSSKDRPSTDDVLADLDREMDEKSYDDELSGQPSQPPVDFDQALAELKRRMNQS
jgi:phage shock protein A